MLSQSRSGGVAFWNRGGGGGAGGGGRVSQRLNVRLREAEEFRFKISN